MKKKKAQTKHAKRRFQQRLGMRLTKEVVKDLVRQIQEGRATLLEKQSNRTSIQVVDHKGQKLPVVYDSVRKLIVTVLPEEDMRWLKYKHIVRKEDKTS